jgi:hypothetical protein
MKSRKLLKFISLTLFLCFVCPIAVSAEKEEQVYIDIGQYRYVNDIDEYLTQLNAETIMPFNSSTTIVDSSTLDFDGDQMVSPCSWPWTDCSNILGHDWGDWSLWEEYGERFHHPGGTCVAQIRRIRFCHRTYCEAYEIEEDHMWVACEH